MAMKREMSVAGTFYPARAVELERYFEYFNKIYEENFEINQAKTRAVIVPHAGYIYSGYTANIAYRVLQNLPTKSFLVIGPSHKIAFSGISMCKFDAYETPFSSIEPASDLFDELSKKFDLASIPQAHAEHSTEVQFPFLKYYLPQAEILELVYSDVDPNDVAKIISYVLKHEQWGVIISTDLSHFYSLEDANKLDGICLDAIEKVDAAALHHGCEACGKIGIAAMLTSAKELRMHSHILDYRTSADASNDTKSVVGYVSAYFN